MASRALWSPGDWDLVPCDILRVYRAHYDMDITYNAVGILKPFIHIQARIDIVMLLRLRAKVIEKNDSTFKCIIHKGVLTKNLLAIKLTQT